jgi:hypothetical protein
MADKQFKRTGRLFIYHFLLHEHTTAADLLPVWACWCFFFFFFLVFLKIEYHCWNEEPAIPITHRWIEIQQ